jgi:NADPH-dependent 2,4-dienoyl-CoA reductase/sulfur reductase-like enzyme/rhodanese-related sulfurtransferase
MDKGKQKVLIIGGVAAGCKTAATLARRTTRFDITVFEKGEHISYATCGLPYFASGDINSFDELTHTSYGISRTPEFFRQSKEFNVVTKAEVISIDRENKTIQVKHLEDGSITEHDYDYLVIATGATPVEPPFPIAQSPKIRHFTKPEDARNFRRSAEQGKTGKAVIIGGGFIGCELVESTAGLWGIETTLVEKEDRLLPYILDSEMSRIVEREMTRQGIDLKVGCKVEKVELDAENNPVVYLDNGETITSDYVFLALGVQPNVRLAKECGLEIGITGAIKVDNFLRTSDPNIFAGGDCIESTSRVTGKPLYLPMGSLANRHGRIIAKNIAGIKTEFNAVNGAFLIKVFDMNVGAVGISESAANNINIKTQSVWGAFADKPDYYPESKQLTLKMIYDKNDNRLLGLQAAGTGDICRRIDVFSTYLNKKATTDDLFDFEHGYAPPYAEALDPLHHLAAIAEAKQRGVKFESPGGIDDDNDTIWLDVREPEEVKALPWPIVETDRYFNIPLNDLKNNLDKLDKSKKIRIICRRGPRSYQSATILKNAGFGDIHIISGGTQAVLS